MVTNDTIEEYLIETGMPYEQMQEGLWLIHDDIDHIDNIVVYHTPPVITFRVNLMNLDNVEDESGLFHDLLTLNATDMVAGAYGLEDNSVVIVDTLQSENLDENEFQASLDAIAMAIRYHYKDLKKYLSTPVLEDDEEETSEESEEAASETAEAAAPATEA
jgi:hypothetical protein